MKKKELKGLIKMSPKEIWNYYGLDYGELRFISEFHCGPDSISDIKEMCRVFTSELPQEGIFYTIDELKIIEKGLYDHLSDYVEKQGGMDKLELIPEEVLNAISEVEFENVFSLLANYLGISEENLHKAFEKKRNK